VSGIIWPDEYRPDKTHVFVSNEIVIPAPPETVWGWLIRAKNWPDWYSNSSNVDRDLAAGVTFHWKTFGVSLESRVREFVPCERLAWDAKSFGVEAYHAWLLERRPDGTTRVLTEETQNGWIARLGSALMPNRMHRFHQIWLKALSAKAQSGKIW
jgi:uncharacterized protein YndB with AHSA1/START domain